MQTSKLSSWVEIDTTTLANNIKSIKNFLKSGVLLTTVVKANGYGHGAVEVAKVAISNGADRLAVARVEEGIQLREAGITVPIQVLSAIPMDSVSEVINGNIIPSLAFFDLAKRVSDIATERNKIVKVHIKIDTGMSRYGVSENEAVKFIEAVIKLPNMQIEGIFTHFASADEEDLSFTHEQAMRFEKIVNKFKVPLIHASNSAATLRFPQYHYDMVRVGLVTYGISPIIQLPKGIILHPVLSFKSRVGLIKRLEIGDTVGYGRTFAAKGPMIVALVMCGYADGLPRFLSNKGFVLINGKRCKILGRVSMDQMTVDISEVKNVQIDNEVVLIGKQGKEEVTADEMAQWASTIPYEIITGISQRVPRLYYKSKNDLPDNY